MLYIVLAVQGKWLAPWKPLGSLGGALGNLGSFPGHLRASPWAPPRPWDLASSIFRCGKNFSCPRVFLATPGACLGTPGASPGQPRECAGPVFHLEAHPPGLPSTYVWLGNLQCGQPAVVAVLGVGDTDGRGPPHLRLSFICPDHCFVFSW